jgi:glycosyltransferase involved in cell wall biosynthesis
MSETGRVTVVIPTRDRPAMVNRSVTSALEQSFRELEVVVVLDGPDPATGRLLAAISDQRLRVLTLPEPAGANAARNAGIRSARTEWIALLDDDDEWLPAKLERQLAVARIAGDDGPPIVACRMAVTLPGNVQMILPRRLPESGEETSEYLFSREGLFAHEAGVQTSMLLAPAQLFRSVPFTEDLRRHHEADWLLRATAPPFSARLLFVDEVLGSWNLSAGAARISASGDWRFSWNWARANRERMTRRAYASFLLTAVASKASQEGAWSAAPLILREALARGQARAVDLLLFVSMWLTPVGLRQWIRQLRHGKGCRR